MKLLCGVFWDTHVVLLIDVQSGETKAGERGEEWYWTCCMSGMVWCGGVGGGGGGGGGGYNNHP